MKRNRLPDVEENPAPKRARGPQPGLLASAGLQEFVQTVAVVGDASILDGHGVRAGDAVAPAPGPAAVIDLTGSCSKQQCGRVNGEDEEDEDFCQIVSEATGPKTAAGGKREKPWYDLTSDSDDESSCWYEGVTVEDEDDVVCISPVTAAAAAGPSSAATAAAATPAAAAAAAAASVAAATAAAIAAKTPQRPLLRQRAPAAAVAAAAGPSSAGAGPSCPCPGCLVDDPDAVQKYNMRMAELQLSPDVSVAQQPALVPGADPRAAVLTGGSRCCADCRRLSALAVVEAAQKQVQKIVGQHSKATISMMQGFVFEVHHAASFNIAAIRAGSLLRAECMEFCSADVRIYNCTQPDATLAMAQLKASRNRRYLAKLNQPKYAELLKVVPAGMEVPARGRRSVLSYEGVSSSPISLQALQWAVIMPGDHFFDLAWAATV